MTTLRRYSVACDGHESVQIVAASSAKARYACYRALCEAGWKYTFRDFLARVRVYYMGVFDGR